MAESLKVIAQQRSWSPLEFCVVDLGTGVVEPLPDRPRGDLAVDEVIPLRSWVAVKNWAEVWAFSRPFTGAGRRVADSFTTCPSVDGDFLWVDDPDHESEFVGIDSEGNQLGPRVVAPFECQVDVVCRVGWILHGIGDRTEIFLWKDDRVDSIGEGRVLASAGSSAVLVRDRPSAQGTGPRPELSVFDIATGKERPLVLAPPPDGIDMTGALTADGAALATWVDFRLEPPLSEADNDHLMRRLQADPAGVTLDELFRVPASEDRLAVGEVESGELSLVPDLTDLRTPFWSADGSQLVMPVGSDRVTAVFILKRARGRVHKAPLRGRIPYPMIDQRLVL